MHTLQLFQFPRRRLGNPPRPTRAHNSPLPSAGLTMSSFLVSTTRNAGFTKSRRPSRVGPDANSSASSTRVSMSASAQSRSAGNSRTRRQGQHIAKPQDLLKEPYVLEFLGLQERATTPNPTSNQQSSATSNTSCLNSAKASSLRHGRSASPSRKNTSSSTLRSITDSYGATLRRSQAWQANPPRPWPDADVCQLLRPLREDRGENSTVGIVLCKKKHTALVEITLPRDANIHAREYQLYLPSKEELQQSFGMD